MPLFASKFVFKKSTRRTLKNLNSCIDDEDEDDINEKIVVNSLENDNDHYGNSNSKDNKIKITKKLSKKRLSLPNDDVSLLIKSKEPQSRRKTSMNNNLKKNGKKVNLFTNKNIDRNTADNHLILNIDKFRKFKFDVKQGIWNDISTVNKSKSIEQMNNVDSKSEANPLISSSPSSSLTSDVQSVNKSMNNNSSTLIDNNNKLETDELIESIKSLKEENRLLKLKIEILIEMVNNWKREN